MNGTPLGHSESEAPTDLDYEPPVVLDLGKVFDMTLGSVRGSSDENGQHSR